MLAGTHSIFKISSIYGRGDDAREGSDSLENAHILSYLDTEHRYGIWERIQKMDHLHQQPS